MDRVDCGMTRVLGLAFNKAVSACTTMPARDPTFDMVVLLTCLGTLTGEEDDHIEGWISSGHRRAGRNRLVEGQAEHPCHPTIHAVHQCAERYIFEQCLVTMLV